MGDLVAQEVLSAPLENQPSDYYKTLAQKYLDLQCENKDRCELRERFIKSNQDAACVLTGWSYFEIAHVVPWSVCTSHEQQIALDNVIPLSPDLHASFDLNEWCFDHNGIVTLSKHLSDTRRRELDRRIFNWRIESRWLKQLSAKNVADRLKLFERSEDHSSL